MDYIKPGLYKHYKGSVYDIICCCTHSETQDRLVVYRGPKGDIWARPLKMFMSTVKLEDGSVVNRFQHLDREW